MAKNRQPFPENHASTPENQAIAGEIHPIPSRILMQQTRNQWIRPVLVQNPPATLSVGSTPTELEPPAQRWRFGPDGRDNGRAQAPTLGGDGKMKTTELRRGADEKRWRATAVQDCWCDHDDSRIRVVS